MEQSRTCSRNQQALQGQITTRLKRIEDYSLGNYQLLTTQFSQLLQVYSEVVELEQLLNRRIQGMATNLAARESKEPPSAPPHLTAREQAVLALFAKGFSYNEAAQILDCKLSTIQTHAKKIYKKLDVHSRAEAVHEASQWPLLEDDVSEYWAELNR